MTILTRSSAAQLVDEQGSDIVIPQIYTSIADSAFYNTELTSVDIPDSVTKIGRGAFAGNKLTSVDIPDSVTKIDGFAFNVNELTSVVIPDNVTKIGDVAFGNNQLTCVVIPDSVARIGREAFYNNKLTSVDIPDSVTKIDDWAFADNQLKSVDIPDSVTRIGRGAFDYNSLETVSISANAPFKLSVFPKDVEIIVREPAPLPLSFYEITSRDEITVFKLTESITVDYFEVHTLIVGTDGKDKITGTWEGEILAGMKGKDVLKGGEGADGFFFNQPGGFGSKHLDQIKDFDSDEGDEILLDQDIFILGKKIKLKSYGSKNKVKKAAKSKNDFVYDEKNGLLYFNENGKQKGWGDGGLFAKLQGAPELGADDFTIV